jgi:medium-chain acyl-[acyl-carrier-protein] hydrolase
MTTPTTLFCFPFAAGSSFSYQPFRKGQTAGLLVQPLDVPGRGRRFGEPSLTSLTDMADDLFSRYADRFAAGPYAFFGHSMGSLLSWLLTHRLMDAGLPLPQHLFLSGRGGPMVAEKERGVYALPTEQLLDKIREIGWQAEAVLGNPAAFAIYERVIRADLEALGCFPYETHPRPLIDVPATVFIGSEDLYTWAEAQTWQAEFSRPIAAHEYVGKHFFLFAHTEAIMQQIRAALMPEKTLADCRL